MFSLNAMDEVQEHFGSLDNLPEKLKGKDMVKNVRWLMTLLLNEGKDNDEEDLTEKQVGRLVHAGNIQGVMSSIYSAFTMGTKGIDQLLDQDDGDADPNAMASEVK